MGLLLDIARAVLPIVIVGGIAVFVILRMNINITKVPSVRKNRKMLKIY